MEKDTGKIGNVDYEDSASLPDAVNNGPAFRYKKSAERKKEITELEYFVLELVKTIAICSIALLLFLLYIRCDEFETLIARNEKTIGNISDELAGLEEALLGINGNVAKLADSVDRMQGVFTEVYDSSSDSAWVEETRHGWLGITVTDATASPDDGNGEELSGVVIVDISEDSPADKAGLKEGDMILSIDGDNVGSLESFKERLNKTSPGDVVKVVIMRDGIVRDDAIEVTLTDIDSIKK